VHSYFPIRDLTTLHVRAGLHIPVLIGPARNAVMPSRFGWRRIQSQPDADVEEQNKSVVQLRTTSLVRFVLDALFPPFYTSSGK
jgi:hypothetical protein